MCIGRTDMLSKQTRGGWRRGERTYRLTKRRTFHLSLVGRDPKYSGLVADRFIYRMAYWCFVKFFIREVPSGKVDWIQRHTGYYNWYPRCSWEITCTYVRTSEIYYFKLTLPRKFHLIYMFWSWLRNKGLQWTRSANTYYHFPPYETWPQS